VETAFERFQTCEEGTHQEPYAQWGLLPICRWDVESLWTGSRVKLVAHDAVSSSLISSSVPQNRGHVSMKVPEVGAADAQNPVINYRNLAVRS